jgi:hypothetical protein
VDPQVSYTLSDEYDAGTWKVMQSEHRGTEARLWKIVTVDGVEESREVFNNSSYRESPKEVTIGTKGGSAEWLSSLQAAIKAGNDEATIKALATTPTVQQEETVPEDGTAEAVTEGTSEADASDSAADKESTKKKKDKNKKEETTEESAQDTVEETPQETPADSSEETITENPENENVPEETTDGNTAAGE